MEIIRIKYRKIIILGVNIIILFLIFTKTVGNIFYAIDKENIFLIKAIVMINPWAVNKKYKGTEFAHNFVYSIPLMYACDRKYQQKDIIMFLLEKTYKYYNDKYHEEIDMSELNIILYNIFKICLIDAYRLNPYLFKDYPDYDIPDKILELGFPLDYYFNCDNYWSIKYWVMESGINELDRIRIKEYLISKGLSFDE